MYTKKEITNFNKEENAEQDQKITKLVEIMNHLWYLYNNFQNQKELHFLNSRQISNEDIFNLEEDLKNCDPSPFHELEKKLTLAKIFFADDFADDKDGGIYRKLNAFQDNFKILNDIGNKIDLTNQNKSNTFFSNYHSVIVYSASILGNLLKSLAFKHYLFNVSEDLYKEAEHLDRIKCITQMNDDLAQLQKIIILVRSGALEEMNDDLVPLQEIIKSMRSGALEKMNGYLGEYYKIVEAMGAQYTKIMCHHIGNLNKTIRDTQTLLVEPTKLEVAQQLSDSKVFPKGLLLIDYNRNKA